MEATVSDDSATEAHTMLAASGLSPAPDEAAMMCAVYPAFRAAIDALYDVAAARYADPALRFRAADTGRADWAATLRPSRAVTVRGAVPHEV